MKKLALLFLGLSTSYFLSAQNVGIGTASPNASAKLDIIDANRGILLPRVALTSTTVAAPITSPANWLIVFNTNTINDVSEGLYYWNGTRWVRLSTSNDWTLLGNAGTNASTNFVGTTDAVDFVTRTNNTEKTRVTSAGNFGIGTNAPTAKLHAIGGFKFDDINTAASAGAGSTFFSEGLNNDGRWRLRYSNTGPIFNFAGVREGFEAWGNGSATVNIDNNGHPAPLLTSTLGVHAHTYYVGQRTGPVNCSRLIMRPDVAANSAAYSATVPTYSYSLETIITGILPADAAPERGPLKIGARTLSFNTGHANGQRTADAANVDVTRMFISQDGNVGIATITPATGLDVQKGTNTTYGGQVLLGTSTQAGRIAFRRGNDGATSAAMGWSTSTSDQNFDITVGSGGGTLTLNAAGNGGNLRFNTTPNSGVGGTQERMRITDVGNVGIGTTAPTVKLDIVGRDVRIADASNETNLRITNANSTGGLDATASIVFQNEANNSWRQYMGGPNNGYFGVLPNAMEWWYYPNGGVTGCCHQRFAIRETTTGYVPVVIDGTGQMFGNGWAQPSDKNLKENINRIDNPVEKVKQLGGYTYRFTEASGLNDNKTHVGVLAQEVEAVLPQAISQFPDKDFKAVDYDAITPLLIEAIKAQQAQIEQLQKEIEQLKKK